SFTVAPHVLPAHSPCDPAPSDGPHAERSLHQVGAASAPRPRRRTPTTLTIHGGAAAAAPPGSSARAHRLRLALLDPDAADHEQARVLLRQGRSRQEDDPREAFELVHRAALRGAGVLVSRANRERRRALPLNVWTALERLGGPEAERARQL